MADMVPVGAIVSSLPHLNACCLLSTGALRRACGRLCTVQVASFAIGRLGELQHWVGELGEVAEGGVG